MNSRFVFDAWTFLALLQGEEPAASRVGQLLRQAENQEIALFASIINLGEVYYRVGRVKGLREAEETVRDIRRLPLTILAATEDDVWAAARLKMEHAISYADAFAAAAARRLAAVLITGDPELARLQDYLQIEKLDQSARQG